MLLPLASPAESQAVLLSYPDQDALSQAGGRIITELYRRIGYEAREAPRGESDGEAMLTIEAEKRFPDLFRVPEPVIDFDIVAFTAGNPALLPNGWSDLGNHAVCTSPGVPLVDDKLGGAPGVELAYGRNTIQVLRLLKAGRCDYAVLPRSAWIEAEEAGITGLAEASPALAHVTAYHFVSRKRAMLVPSLAAVLRQLRSDGTIAKAEAELEAATAEAQAAVAP